MATIVGVRVDGEAAVGGDERTTEGSVVTGRARRVWDGGEVGAAAVGDPGGVEAFVRTLTAELRRQRAEGAALSITRVASVAADLAREHEVDAIVVARDDEGIARLREVLADGGVLETEATARGSGASIATGVLESGDDSAAADLVREALAAAAERDAETGDDVDLFRLADGS